MGNENALIDIDYQHPSLYRGIVNVTWKSVQSINQLNVWFLF